MSHIQDLFNNLEETNKEIFDKLEKIEQDDLDSYQQDIKDGKFKCKYCGRPSAYTLSNNNEFCCSEYARKCPGFSKWLNINMKQRYKDNPQHGINMSKAMKEAQNRPEVAEKKRAAMKKLHNQNCDKCTDFQKNYIKGKALVTLKTIEKYKKYLIKNDRDIEGLTDYQITFRYRYYKLMEKPRNRLRLKAVQYLRLHKIKTKGWSFTKIKNKYYKMKAVKKRRITLKKYKIYLINNDIDIDGLSSKELKIKYYKYKKLNKEILNINKVN